MSTEWGPLGKGLWLVAPRAVHHFFPLFAQSQIFGKKNMFIIFCIFQDYFKVS